MKVRLVVYSLLSLGLVVSFGVLVKWLGLRYLVYYWHFVKYSLLSVLFLVWSGVRVRSIIMKRKVVILLSLVLVLTLYDSFTWFLYNQPTQVILPTSAGNGSFVNPFYFIAGNLYNNGDILPHYISQVDTFINLVGPENVFVSIVEDHSIDTTVELLLAWQRDLQARQVRHRVLTSFNMPNPASVDRIQKLAYLRNAALQPYFQLNLPLPPNSKVIFLNDILFFSQDLVTLINTDQGNYDIACGTDYDGIGMYDTWVLRDILGQFTSSVYPIFTRSSDQAKWLRLEPVEVYSCWNGVVTFNHDIVYHHFNSQLVTHNPFTSLTKFHPQPPPPRPTTTNPTGVRFRSRTTIDECYSSECLLIFKDLRQLHPRLIVKINPLVKVGYQFRYYFLWKELLNWSGLRYLLKLIAPLHWNHINPIPHRDQFEYQCY